jgi:caffeoyl-CoA O-methyltransferase
MDFLPKNLNDYSEKHTEVFRNEVLREIERYTHLKVLMPQMLSGHLQGQYLAFISQLIQPKRILEIGTFTGYSAICLAQGLTEDGLLHSYEVNEELKAPVEGFFEKAGLANKIKMHIGDAMEMLDDLDEVFDLVFIDADKENYPSYYEKIFPKVRIGGCILVDNVLWSGKVTESVIKDKKTKGIHELNECIQNDDRVGNVLLPLRDGIMMVRKLRD